MAVLELGLNAYCVGDSISCLSRCVMICSFSNVSNTLAMIGSNDIGR